MKSLILNIDRDNDLGRKTRIKGPVIGEKKVLAAACALARSDPSETDSNAMFAALKLFDEIKGQKEVAVITGSVRVGYESDMEVGKQLDKLLKKTKPDGVILVTDGQEDEYVLPLIESKVRIISVNRIVVKQSEQLKGLYYSVQELFKRAREDPGLAKLVFGIPGIIAVFYALFGTQGWRILAGLLGLYLLIRGLNIDQLLGRLFHKIKTSFATLSMSFFLYLLALVLTVVGFVRGMNSYGATALEITARFVFNSALSFYYAALMTLFGFAIDSWHERRKALSYIGMGVSLGVVVLVLKALSQWVLDPTYPLTYVVTTSVLGALIVISIKLLFVRKTK